MPGDSTDPRVIRGAHRSPQLKLRSSKPEASLFMPATALAFNVCP